MTNRQKWETIKVLQSFWKHVLESIAGSFLPLCIAYVPLAVVIDGSHFDDPTPTPNAPSGPIARTDATKCAITQITLNTEIELIFLPHF